MGRESIGPVVAGSWYPGDSEELGEMLRELLGADATGGGSSPAAIVAPHAGLVHSGRVAGAGFGRLRGTRVSRVVLIGPSHTRAFHGACVPCAETYRTPLGEVPIDRQAIGELAGMEGIERNDDPFLREHCLEMEIPFLQVALDGAWPLLPVLVGSLDPARGNPIVARALAAVLRPDDLVVVSSDFTHFGGGFGFTPFRDRVAEQIRELDLGAVRHILERDANRFAAYTDRTGATICGRHAIEILLRLRPDGPAGALTAYDNSGNMTGDWSHCVSYASLVFEPRAGARENPT